MHSTYLDNNATTRLDPRVLDAMLPLFTEHWGNAGSCHHVGMMHMHKGLYQPSPAG